MAGEEQVDWTIPAAEWSATFSHLSANDKKRAPYIRIHVETAMKEWIDEDVLLGTENLIQQYEETCSYSFSRFSQTSYSISMDDDVDKTSVRTWIDADLKDDFRQVVDENTDYRDRYGVNRYGAALATALRLYRDGGRRQRINDRIRRLIEAEESVQSDGYDPAELGIHYSDVDLDRLDGRSRKKKVYQIAQRLDPGLKDVLHREHELRETIADIAGKSVVDAYVDDVVDVLNFKEHPTNPVLFVHESWEPETDVLGETAMPADVEPAAVDRKSFDEMTKDERLESIRLQLARKADRKDRTFLQVDYNFIQREVFDRQTSPGYANNIMADAANAPGFDFVTKDGAKRLKVNLGKINDDLRNLLSLEPEPDPEPSAESPETEDESDARDELEDEAAAAMAALDQAKPEESARSAVPVFGDGGTVDGESTPLELKLPIDESPRIDAEIGSVSQPGPLALDTDEIVNQVLEGEPYPVVNDYPT